MWTHTLFLEFPDLATIRAPSRLASLFVRPDPTTWSTYNQPRAIDFDEGADPDQLLTPDDEDWLANVLNRLYRFPAERVLTNQGVTLSAEALTLRIWDQQWPRLRRSFRFCTLSTMDRSTSGAVFDLQIAPSKEASSRFRQRSTLEAVPSIDVYTLDDWLGTLIQDIRHPNLDGLRDTLKTLGADILGGREAMLSLCDFHRLTTSLAPPFALKEAIRMVEGQGPLSSSDMARARLAEYLLSRVDDADDSDLAFLWKNLHFVEPGKLLQRLPEVALSIWRALPRQVFEELRRPTEAVGDWAACVVKAIPAETLLEYWPDDEAPFKELIAVRPDLLDISTFWRVADVGFPVAFPNIDLSSDRTVDAMIEGLYTSSAMRSAVELAGPLRILESLHRRSSVNDVSSFMHWVPYCLRDSSVAGEFLNQPKTLSVPLLQAMTSVLEPDSVPNDYGDDPWLAALLKVKVETGYLPLGLAAYGFSRALGWRSRSVAELLQLTFDPLHGAVSTSSLEDSYWRLIEHRLPWVRESERWDRGRRLRAIVAKLFIDKRLVPRAFARMATSGEVFVALMDEALSRYGGRRFLQDVESSLQSDSDEYSQARQELIRNFLNGRKRK